MRTTIISAISLTVFASGCLSTQLQRINIAGEASHALKAKGEIEARFNTLVKTQTKTAEMEAVKVYIGTVPESVEINEKSIGIKSGFEDNHTLIGTVTIWFPHGGVSDEIAIVDMQRLGVAADGNMVVCTKTGGTETVVAFADCAIVKQKEGNSPS